MIFVDSCVEFRREDALLDVAVFEFLEDMTGLVKLIYSLLML